MVRISLRTVVHDVPPAGHHHARQRLGEGQRGRLLPRRRTREGGRRRSRTTSTPRRSSPRRRCGACSARRSLDELLSEREKLNVELQKIIDQHTEPVGHQGLARRGQAGRPAARDAARDGEAGRGRAREAREDHPRRGRVRGRDSALARRPRSSTRQPATLQLRYLQTLTEIATEKNSTIVFPLPIDLISDVPREACRASGEAEAGRRAARLLALRSVAESRTHYQISLTARQAVGAFSRASSCRSASRSSSV